MLTFLARSLGTAADQLVLRYGRVELPRVLTARALLQPGSAGYGKDGRSEWNG